MTIDAVSPNVALLRDKFSALQQQERGQKVYRFAALFGTTRLADVSYDQVKRHGKSQQEPDTAQQTKQPCRGNAR